MLQSSTLSDVLLQQPKALYHAGLSYFDGSFIVNLQLTWLKSASLSGFGH